MEFVKRWYFNGLKFGATVIIASVVMISTMELAGKAYNDAF